MTEPRSEPRVIVLIPTYNERDHINHIVMRIHAAVPEASVLVIDDGSPDGTGDIADSLARSHTWVSVLHRSEKLGLGTAYIAGFRWGLERSFTHLVEMDADGSHQPEQLATLLDAALEGAGLVIGSRWVPGGLIRGWPHTRRWISRAGTLIARICLRSQLHDITSGYRVFDANWLAQLPLEHVASQGYSFQVEVAWTLERWGCPITEVPITFAERQSGTSKMSISIVWEALTRVCRWGWWLRTRPNLLLKPQPPVTSTAAAELRNSDS